MSLRVYLVSLVIFSGLLGCTGKGECPVLFSPPPGTYKDIDTDGTYFYDASAVIDDTTVTITYTTKDGSRWKATYSIGAPL